MMKLVVYIVKRFVCMRLIVVLLLLGVGATETLEDFAAEGDDHVG